MSPVAPSELTPPSLPWRLFGPILAVHFLGTLGFSLAVPFLVFIVADLGGASWTYGLIGATYSTFQLVGAPLLGGWSDRAGRKPVLVASQVGTLGAWILFFVALSMPVVPLGQVAGAAVTLPLLVVFAARALDGATGGNISVANAYVADLTRTRPELRDKAFGRMGMAASLGFVVGPAAGGLLGGTSLGARLPIAISALFAAVTTGAIVLGLREPNRPCANGPPEPGPLDSGLQQQSKPCHKRPEKKVLRTTIQRDETAPLLVATFLTFLGFNFFYAAFPVHASRDFGWESHQLGAFFAVLAGLMFIAQGPILTFALKRWDRRAVFAVGLGFLVLAMISFQLPGGPGGYLSGACFALGNGLAWPVFQSRVSEVGGERQGTVQGAVASASSLASIAGLVGGGLLYPKLGGDLFLGAALLFCIVLVLTPRWFGTARATSPGKL